MKRPVHASRLELPVVVGMTNLEILKLASVYTEFVTTRPLQALEVF